VKTEREFRQGFCLSPILFNLYTKYHTKEWSGGFKGRGQVIRSVKYADNFELMVKEETCDRA